LRIEVPELSLLRPILSAGTCLALVLLFFASPAWAAQDSAAQPKKHTTADPKTPPRIEIVTKSETDMAPAPKAIAKM